jgi:hypothetical protein
MDAHSVYTTMWPHETMVEVGRRVRSDRWISSPERTRTRISNHAERNGHSGNRCDKYLFTADSDAALKSERSGWRDYLQVAVGLLLMSAIALGELEVFARLYANTGMVR